MRSILDGIPVAADCDYLQQRERFEARRGLVFTGPIDEYFGFDLGRLAYRGQLREHDYLPDTDLAQPFGQVNNPDPGNGPHVRTLEWKHMLSAGGTEGCGRHRPDHGRSPFAPTDPDAYEYPFPDARQQGALPPLQPSGPGDPPRLLVCGRLGEYRYYDMDQAIARAMLLAKRRMLSAMTAARIPVIRRHAPPEVMRPGVVGDDPDLQLRRLPGGDARSVLAQDPGPEVMQIEVVDDCSTDRPPRGCGGRRSAAAGSASTASPATSGSPRNFTACLQRSRGQLVHVLHGDDLVYPGFYATVGSILADHPEVGGVVIGAEDIDETGDGHGTNEILCDPAGRAGATSTRRSSSGTRSGRRPSWPGAGVRAGRGFHDGLRFCADWDMWKRLATRYHPGVRTAVLVGYRVHGRSDTAKLGDSIAQLREMIDGRPDRPPLPARGDPGVDAQVLRDHPPLGVGPCSATAGRTAVPRDGPGTPSIARRERPAPADRPRPVSTARWHRA